MRHPAGREMRRPTTGEEALRLRELAPLVRQGMAHSRAPSTQELYSAIWGRFEAWCAASGLAALPADESTLAAWLSERAAVSSPATMSVMASAIRAAHAAAGHRDPITPRVKEVLAGWRRLRAGPQRQAAPLDDEALAAIRRSAHIPRRGESPERTAARAATDIAICVVASDCGLRVSELADLRWADVQIEDDGGGVVHVRRSKTDQFAVGATLGLTPAGARALEAIQPSPRQPTDLVFGLAARSLRRRIIQAAAQAGLEGRFSGHSGRVGLAIRLAERGAEAAVVSTQGRWRDPAMYGRYTRNWSARRAARVLEEPVPEVPA